MRDLNDYESMLATSTCNVGLKLTLPPTNDDQVVESNLREAWSRTVENRKLLQVRLVAKDGQMGLLGQRYSLAPMEDASKKELFVVERKEQLPSLIRKLQSVGVSALNITKGSYFVACTIQKDEYERKVVQFVFSLCHALSDGPGALMVARSFLRHLSNVIDGIPMDKVEIQPLTDLQAVLLGEDYAKAQKEQPVFVGKDEFASALARQPPSWDDGTPVLPPEAMQGIPKDDGFGGPSFIDCVHFSLTPDEASLLRSKCREHGTTVQGALVAAALKARLELLDTFKNPIVVAVQIPVNTRTIAKVDEDFCLCGSAGVWHISKVAKEAEWWEIAKDSTQTVRAALQDEEARHPKEWLRRLMNNPATLAPYSLMVSSVGVAPVEASYGSVQVEELNFFGAALRNDEEPSQAIGSMIHAVTFRDKFHCFFNFTSPGISKEFAEKTAESIKKTLQSFTL